MGILSIEWPPSSSDLNPIKWIWHLIKQRVRKRRPFGGWSLSDLKQAVFEEWEKLKPEDYRKIISGLSKRIEEVRRRNGGPLGF